MMYRVIPEAVNTLLLSPLSTQIAQYQTKDNSTYILNIYDYINSQIQCNAHKFLANPFSEKDERFSTSTAQFRQAYKYLSSCCQSTFFRKDDDCRREFHHCLQIAFIECLAASLALSEVHSNSVITLTLPLQFRDKMEIPTLDGAAQVFDAVDHVVMVTDFTELFTCFLAGDGFDIVSKRLVALGPKVAEALNLSMFYQQLLDNPSDELKQITVQAWLAIQRIYAFRR